MALERAVVEEKAAGMRLDVFVTQHFGETMEQHSFSRSRLQRLIAEGHITVNGAMAKSSTRLKTSDLVELCAIPPTETNLTAEAVPLDLVYEDSECVVVNKAPGMVVHPAAGSRNGTLVNALLYHCPNLRGIGGEGRPGIVHRLDKDTSGVMVVAKNHRSLQHLARQFKDRTVQKEYLALVWGKFDEQSGIIDRPIGRHRSQRQKMSSLHAHPRTREAITEWSVEKTFKMRSDATSIRWVTFLRLKPRTGRTHQIRVHLADRGHPLVGDKVYGRRDRSSLVNRGITMLVDIFPRQALHAERLAFDHPKSGLRVEFKVPICDDMARLLMELEKINDGSLFEIDRG